MNRHDTRQLYWDLDRVRQLLGSNDNEELSKVLQGLSDYTRAMFVNRFLAYISIEDRAYAFNLQSRLTDEYAATYLGNSPAEADVDPGDRELYYKSK
ncbi:hypothetical protein A2W24_04250 [Microgenomates group bacterium RBG_16_45_19]|nr:MAG: hypothetical protein A2W24_04250 [Microgenomates group bacterium RBG_16_45_19]